MSSDLETIFKEAFKKASETKKALPPDVLLRLYSYYKQATKGDRFNSSVEENSSLRNAFKFNAWVQLKGMNTLQAKQEYIRLVNEVLD